MNKIKDTDKILYIEAVLNHIENGIRIKHKKQVRRKVISFLIELPPLVSWILAKKVFICDKTFQRMMTKNKKLIAHIMKVRQ